MPAHDVLIIGAGLAGQRAALAAAQPGATVAILSKVHPVRSHSVAAAGGINAAINPADDWRSHAYDTVKGSDFLGDQDAIEIMCREAPAEVLHLEHIGVTFHRNESGEMDLRAFGGASMKRTAYVADITGQALLHVLYEQLMKHHEVVDRYEEWFVTSLCIDEEGACVGAVARQIRDGHTETFSAKNVILASGGAGQCFKPTTNALICTADGIAQAYTAGAPLMDMEMIQYHPTLPGRERLPDHRGRARRGRPSPQLRGRALHGEVRAQQDGARLARRRLARRADRDPRGPRRRPRRRRDLPRHHGRAEEAHARGAARDRQHRQGLRRRRHHQGADPDPARPALHHGRRQDRHRRRDADRRPLRRRRGRLRLGPRRQPPGRQLAARHADLRPPRRRARRRARRRRCRCRPPPRRRASATRRRSPRSSRGRRPAAHLADQGRARHDDEPPRRGVPRGGRPAAGARGRSPAQGGGQDRLRRRQGHRLQPGRAGRDRARLHARLLARRSSSPRSSARSRAARSSAPTSRAATTRSGSSTSTSRATATRRRTSPTRR